MYAYSADIRQCYVFLLTLGHMAKCIHFLATFDFPIFMGPVF